jgi:hypothetical protein
MGPDPKERRMNLSQNQTITMQDGDDFVCPNCGCEIRLIHHGDPERMPRMQPFTCCCGTRMDPEEGGGNTLT